MICARRSGQPDGVEQAVLLGLQAGDLAADRVVGQQLVLVGRLTPGDRLGDLVGQGQLAAVADAEGVGDLVDRRAPQGGDHEPLGLFLAAGQGRFVGLDRLQLGVGVGQAERGQGLGVGLAGDAVEEGRVAGLDPFDGLGDPGGDPVAPVDFSVTVSPGMGLLLGCGIGTD